MPDLRHSLLFTIALIIILTASAQGTEAANPSQLQDVQIARTLYIEPSYQVYVDEVTVSQTSGSYNITFILPTPGVIFEAKAYGLQNQSLSVTRTPQTTNGTYNGNLTLTIETTGLTAFRLVTIVQGMTYAIGNFSTLVNFFPVVDEAANASTTIYLPSGSGLVSYSLASLSNSSQAARPTVFGTSSLTPKNSTYGIVTYSGNFSTVAAGSLSRTIRISPTHVEFSETMILINTATTPIKEVKMNAPSGATGTAARDTIGALQSSVSNGIVTVALRDRIYHNERAQFTLTYSLPASIIQAEGGRSIITGNVLPDFLNMPCDSVNVTVVMPTWSTSPQMAGGQVVEKYYGPVASAAFSSVTPYTNQAFSASYVQPSLTTQAVFMFAVLALALVIMATIVLRWRFFPQRRETTAPPQAKGDAKQGPKGK